MIKNAYLAGGCFWCIAYAIEQIEGVNKVISGYCGGEEINPSYEDVKAQKTSHRETIKVIYDNQVLSYHDLLKSYLENVDPFDDGGQFIDRGYSYTLAIYYNDLAEYEIARALITELEKKTQKNVYIALEPFNCFYEAEEEHQDYYAKEPNAFNEELIKSGRKKGE